MGRLGAPPARFVRRTNRGGVSSPNVGIVSGVGKSQEGVGRLKRGGGALQSGGVWSVFHAGGVTSRSGLCTAPSCSKQCRHYSDPSLTASHRGGGISRQAPVYASQQGLEASLAPSLGGLDHRSDGGKRPGPPVGPKPAGDFAMDDRIAQVALRAVVARRHIEPLLEDDQLLPMLPSAVLQREPSRPGRVFGQQALTLAVVHPLLALELLPTSSPTERGCSSSRAMACVLTQLAGIIKSPHSLEPPTGRPE